MNELTAGFWDAARRHELVVQRCDACARLRHYPQYLCPQCQSDAWSWVPVDGNGVVHSFTVTHRAFGAAWAERVPYAIATIELDNGIRMLSDLPADDVDDVAIGKRVEVWFDDVGDDVTLPRFRLVR